VASITSVLRSLPLKMLKPLICLTTLLAFTCARKGGKSFEVLVQPPSQIEVKIGRTVSVVCAAHGHSMMDPIVYWVKGIGVRHKDEGRRLPVTAVGKSVLYIEAAAADDIASYKCVIEDLCTGDKEEFELDIDVPDDTCQDVYGVGHVVYGATWSFRNWTAAIQDCESKGMEIAMPTSEEENAELLRNLQASFNTHPNARKFAHENWVWIGAHDMTKEGEFTSVIDEQLLTDMYPGKLPWAPKQPDNRQQPNSGFPEDQDVVGIHRDKGYWDDSFEHYNRPYACLCPKKKGKGQ